MDRIVDAAAVALLLGATLFAGPHARDGAIVPSASSEPTVRPADFATTVAAALPELEDHVASGSWKDRGDHQACLTDERQRLATLEAIERELSSGASDYALEQAVTEAFASLRTCVGCAPTKSGCAAAARTLTRIEAQLARGRAGDGI